MSKREDGGPAFPCPQDAINQNAPSLGMSLRDYFAAKAMQVEFETACRSRQNAKALNEAARVAGQTVEQRIAENAYDIADAMLAARDAS